MTKRSAMLVAAGLVAALMVGAAALSFGLTGNGSAQAETTAPDPIVRTVHRTVRVEKDAKPAQQPVQVVQVASVPSTTSNDVSEGTFDDDAYEGDEDEDYEDEGSEDHESEGSDDSGSMHSNESGGEHEDD